MAVQSCLFKLLQPLCSCLFPVDSVTNVSESKAVTSYIKSQSRNTTRQEDSVPEM
jgi:hypothetical protein